MSIVYCCYGMYSDIGHSDDCPTRKPTMTTPAPAVEAALDAALNAYARNAADWRADHMQVREDRQNARAALLALIRSAGEGRVSIETERDRLLGLAEKATPGPWRVQWHTERSNSCDATIEGGSRIGIMYEAGIKNTANDFEFIAAAHDMIALIRAQAAEIERLKGRDER